MIHEKLSRWFKLPWPPGWRWCCCKSAPSSAGSAACVSCSVNLPLTIHVTFSNSTHCPKLDGQTFTLTYSSVGMYGFASAAWYYAFTDSNGCSWVMVFDCQTSTSLQFCLNYSTVSMLFHCTGKNVYTCSPLNAVFSPVQYNTGGGTCGTCVTGGNSPLWTVTATP